MSRWTTLPVAALLLAGLAGALYGPKLAHEFVTDDAIYIVENPAVTRGRPLAAYFLDRSTIASDREFHRQAYRPLRTLAFRTIAVVAGVRPIAFGMANLILYVTGALLIVMLGRRLGVSPGASFMAAALWVAAPVHVEPVLYASALGDHMSMVLELASLLLALRGRWLPAVLSVGLALAAMLTKEMAVTEPLLIAALAWATGVPRRRATILIAAHCAAALLFMVLRTAVLHAFGHAVLTGGGLLAGVAMAPWRLAAYVRIVIQPLGHSAGYVLLRPGWPILLGAWVGLGLAILALRRTTQLVRIGAAWFALTLLPVLGVVPLLADLADRFALLPSVGLALAAPAAATALARRNRLAGWLVATLVSALFAAGTVVESAGWKDDATLWAKAVALDRRSAQAHRNLGVILLQQGQPAEALHHFDEARALGDADATSARRRAEALEALGRWGEAEVAAAAAVVRAPQVAAVHAVYGGVLVRRGALTAAQRALARAVALEPDSPSTLLLAVKLAARRGDRAGMDAAEARLIALYPAEPRFRYHRALTLTQARDPGAVPAARACLDLAPDNPQCQCLLGRALVDAGETGPQAREAIDRGLRGLLPPDDERDACDQARQHLSDASAATAR